MSSPRTALITGASIAGPTLAYWLTRYGWNVTVVERSPEPRSAGQNVDVRGAGAEVLARMGLLEAVRSRRTGERGLVFVGPSGRDAGRFPAGGSSVEGATAELEVLRGDLSSLITQRHDTAIEFRYGETVTSVEDGAEAVTAHLSGGQERRVDVVVACDGLNSSTRDILGLGANITPVGLETTYFTIPRTPEDDDWWRWFVCGRGRSVHLRPDPYGTIRATLNVLVPPQAFSDTAQRSRQQQIDHLLAIFDDAGWHTPRVLEGLRQAEDIYYEHLGQIRGAVWSTGRCALAGDAAFCASPLSGMGTTLAVVGAYVLATELASQTDHSVAFGRYETTMRPYVEKAQKLPPGGPRLANPMSRPGASLLSQVTRVLATPPLRRLGDSLSARPADHVNLPPVNRARQADER